MKDARERGAAMVEFALIFTFVLMPLMLGLIEYGYRYERSARLNNAAFIAARTLSIHKTSAEAVAAAKSADPTLTDSTVTVSASYPAAGADCTSGSNVTFNMTVVVKSPTKSFPPGATTFTVNAKGVARCDG